MFREGVLRPEKYLSLLVEKLQKLKKLFLNKKYSNDSICKSLTNYFKNEKIVFIYDETANSSEGLTKGGYNIDTNEIILKCDSGLNFILKDVYDIFETDFYEMVGHELIHRLQYLNSTKNTFKKYNTLDEKQILFYLSDKKEIMSYAWQTIEIFKMLRLNKKVILQIIKNPEAKENNYFVIRNDIFFLYRKYFDSNSVIYKLFVKYIYMYLDEK